MKSDVEQIIATLEASAEKYHRALEKAKKQTDKNLKRVEWKFLKFKILSKIPFVKYFMKDKPPKIWPPTR